MGDLPDSRGRRGHLCRRRDTRRLNGKRPSRPLREYLSWSPCTRPSPSCRSHGLPTFADLAEQAETPAYAQAIDDGTLRFCEQAVSEALTAAPEETGVEVTEINAELSAASDGIIIHNVSVAVSAASADKIEEFSLSAERRLGFPVSITAE